LVFNLRKSLHMIVPLCLMSAAIVHADEKVMISSTIPYENSEAANDDIRKECDWNQQLAKNIVKESNSTVEATDKDLAKISGKKLEIMIDHVHAIGGGSFTGPKWAHIRGKLSNNGKVIGNFEALRRTIGGSFKACSTLNNLGEELGQDVAGWLINPTLDAKLGDAG
jgi:hypothetical protein